MCICNSQQPTKEPLLQACTINTPPIKATICKASQETPQRHCSDINKPLFAITSIYIGLFLCCYNAECLSLSTVIVQYQAKRNIKSSISTSCNREDTIGQSKPRTNKQLFHEDNNNDKFSRTWLSDFWSMGSFCCCPCGEDFEEYAHPSSSIYRHCICLRYFFHQLFSGFIFQRLEGRAVTSPAQGVAPLTSTGLSNPSADSSFSETHHLLPIPAPYDTDPRHSRLQRDGLVSRREKSMSHIQEDSQLLSRSSSSSCVEHLGFGKKNSADLEEERKSCRSESEKIMSAKGLHGTGYVLTTSEDEDICPTCLDEYTPENPKIITKCSHHFHLGCIYEWMERSEFCPLCGKEMEFCESP